LETPQIGDTFKKRVLTPPKGVNPPPARIFSNLKYFGKPEQTKILNEPKKEGKNSFAGKLF